MADPLEALRKASTIGPTQESKSLRGLEPGPRIGPTPPPVMGAMPLTPGDMGGPLKGLLGLGKLSPMLEEIFAAHPGARAIYNAAHAPQVEDAFISRAGQSVVDSNRLEKAKNALMNLDEGYPSPIPSKTGMEYAVPKPPPPAPPRVTPKFESKFILSPELENDYKRFAAHRSGLTSWKKPTPAKD